jgi:peptidoglycan/LPS O-acetylase OafA/YrhL
MLTEPPPTLAPVAPVRPRSATSPAPQQASRFAPLDGLRAVAAFAVLAYHFVGTAEPAWLTGQVRQAVWLLGDQGVAVFFLLSGFLLYRPFAHAALGDVPVPEAGPFWLRRFARIYPGYWVALLAVFLLLPLTPAPSVGDLLTHGALLQNYRVGYFQKGSPVAWTLVIEVSFYVAVPIIAWALRAASRSVVARRNRARIQVAGIAALGLAALGARAWDFWLSDPSGLRTGQWYLGHVDRWLLGTLDWFALGMALAVASVWMSDGGALPRVLRWLARRPGATWALAGGLYLATMQLELARQRGAGSDAYGRLFAEPLLVGIAAFLVLVPLVLADGPPGRVHRFLGAGPMAALGVISYGIYLWHLTFIRLSASWVSDGWLPDDVVVRGSVVVALTLVAALLSYRLVERPVIRWSHRRSARRFGRRLVLT